MQEVFNAILVFGQVITGLATLACATWLSIYVLGIFRKFQHLVVVFFIVLIGFGKWGFGAAENEAMNAITIAWEAARTEQATYQEVLHAPFVNYGEDIHQCHKTVDNLAGVNCIYYSTEEINRREVCTTYTDSDGDTEESCHWESDTQYTPWFTFERSPWGQIAIDPRFAEAPLVMVSGEAYPRLYFASHLAPEDAQGNEYEWGAIPWIGANYNSATPQDWIRVRDGILSGQPIVGSVYHSYLNFFHANDDDLFELYGGNIERYEEANLLPTMNNIYSGSGETVGFDYNFVQFLGGVRPTESEQVWQEYAAEWAAYAGPNLQASLILFFAPASEITNRTEWINTSKAYLMDEDVFGRRILPKNLVLLGCAVSDDNSTIAWCELETGMFAGNDQLQLLIQRVSNIPFTIEGVFGDQRSTYERVDGSQQFVLQRGQGLLEMLYAPEPNGFRRQRMGPNDYLMTSVQPSEEQRWNIVNNGRWGVARNAAFQIALAIVITVVLTFMSYSDSISYVPKMKRRGF